MKVFILVCAVWSWCAVCFGLGFPVFVAVDKLDRRGEPLTRQGWLAWSLYAVFICTGLGICAGSIATRWIDDHQTQQASEASSERPLLFHGQ